MTDHLGSVRVIVDGSGVVKERNDYYPFGARQVRSDYSQLASNRYKYNGKEEQVTGDLRYLDYGARMYDKTLVRWFINDPLGEKYLDVSGYAYCLDNPVNAIDPDGEVVIFINGMHGGDGGSSKYWRKTYMEYNSQTRMYDIPVEHAFDREVMNHLADFNAIYKDGALGGTLGFPLNMSSKLRKNFGYFTGIQDARFIIDGLARDEDGNIIETIKVVTHSMGGAYGIGYVSAILEYAYSLGINLQVDFIANFAPFQSESLEALYGMPFLQYSHSKDPIAGNKPIRGATIMDTSEDEKLGHSLFDFWEQIMNLPQGEYKIENGRVVPK